MNPVPHPVFAPPPPLPDPPPDPRERLERIAASERWADDSRTWPGEARRLLDRRDLDGLVAYYDAKARTRPFDLHVRLRQGEALLRADRPEEALEVLRECHRRAPELRPCRGLLIDVLRRLDRPLDDVDWEHEPLLLDLDDDLIDRFLGFLKARRRAWAVDDLHRWLEQRADRLLFTPDELLRALLDDQRFEADEMGPGAGDPSTTWIRPAGTERERRWFPEE